MHCIALLISFALVDSGNFTQRVFQGRSSVLADGKGIRFALVALAQP